MRLVDSGIIETNGGDIFVGSLLVCEREVTMKSAVSRAILGVGAIAGLLVGCNDDANRNSGTGGTSTGGPATGGSTTRGSATSATTGSHAGGVAGASAIAGAGGTSGSSGMNVGGAAGASCAAGGASEVGGATAFWPSAYDPTGTAPIVDGHHNAGQNCTATCHVAGNKLGAPIWLYAGTAYESDGTTPIAHAEVGVSDGIHTFTVYTAANGNFWAPSCVGTLSWALTEARIRDTTGEKKMVSMPTSTCNGCHSSTLPLKAP